MITGLLVGLLLAVAGGAAWFFLSRSSATSSPRSSSPKLTTPTYYAGVTNAADLPGVGFGQATPL